MGLKEPHSGSLTHRQTCTKIAATNTKLDIRYLWPSISTNDFMSE
jgi:hypothetical protein